MQVDPKLLKSAIVAGLPLRARWTINGTPLDYDFSIARRGLHQLADCMVESGEKEWFDLLIFGKDDYAQGGGASAWLGIRKADGVVYGLDPEREIAMFLLNSSIDRFIQTFEYLHKFLAEGKQLPLAVEARLREIDPEAYPKSEWRLLVDCVSNTVEE